MKLTPISHLLFTLIIGLGLAACGSHPNTTSGDDRMRDTQISSTESEKLNTVVEAFFKDFLALNPVYATFVGVNEYNDRFSKPINENNLAELLAFEKKYLAAIQAIDAKKLSGQDLLSYQIFKRDRELGIQEFQFNGHLLPISQMGGAHSYFALLGSGASAQPFNSERDYRDFLKRSQGFVVYMDSVVEAMKQGAERGLVLPEPVTKKLIPQLQTHLVDDLKDSIFYSPVMQLANKDTISDESKQALTQDYRAAIEEQIIPAYRRLHDYIKNDYLKQARTTVGLSALPQGDAWYAFKIQEQTTLSLSPEEIHQFGKHEVARILAEMQAVKNTVKFDGSLAAFFDYLREDEQFYFSSEAELIAAYEEVKASINAKVPQLFEVFPRADYEVRAVEAFRAASAAGASYQSPAPDGSRPGIFYINSHNLKAQPKFLVETLSIHEAAPGHHFQISIQQEVENLPQFRRFGGYTVFAEGWALYAESLGKEMGLFTDPYMWYGRLSDEQLRAMRLVVDTGVHAFGWSRQQAIDYMLANSSMAESDVVAEVERYIAIPGQALSYKTGERHIRMLRTKAKEALGDEFDIKKFHTQILIDGALPMPILESKIDRWIEAQQAG